MRATGPMLVVLGALLTAVGVAPFRYAESGTLPNITSSYVLMMVVPAVLAVAPLIYQRARGLDVASVAIVLLAGVVIGTIPFWGPSLDVRMQMKNDWIGTIAAHYTAGAVVVLGGLLELRELTRTRAAAVAQVAEILVVIGALLTAFGVVPFEYLDTGRPSEVNSSYILMMVVPAVLAAAPLVYQRARGLDVVSIAIVLLGGIVIATIPFWGPALDPGMAMPLDWVGTIFPHYVAGGLVLIGGFYELRELMRRRSAPLPT